MSKTAISPSIIQHQIFVLITKVINCTKEKIINFDVLYFGHSSIVFQFQIFENPQIYCLRWNLTKKDDKSLVNRWRNEYYYIHGSEWKNDYLYFDWDNGHYIKKKISGDKLDTKQMTNELWIKVILKLIKFQNQKILFKNRFGYSSYNTYLNETCPVKDDDLALFIKIGNLNQELPVVFAHNSLNLKNIIYDGINPIFIDFEWVAHNNNYFDLASLIFDANLNDEMMKFLFDTYNKNSTKKLIWKTLQLFVYFVASLTYQWADHQIKIFEDNDEIKNIKKTAFIAMLDYKKRFELKKWLLKRK